MKSVPLRLSIETPMRIRLSYPWPIRASTGWTEPFLHRSQQPW